MAYCEKCGKRLPAGNNNFCPACGAPVMHIDEEGVEVTRQLNGSEIDDRAFGQGGEPITTGADQAMPAGETVVYDAQRVVTSANAASSTPAGNASAAPADAPASAPTGGPASAPAPAPVPTGGPASAPTSGFAAPAADQAPVPVSAPTAAPAPGPAPAANPASSPRFSAMRLVVPAVAGALVAAALGAAYFAFGPGAAPVAPADATATVPELAGSSQDEAARALIDANLTVGAVKLQACDDHHEGEVCESAPAAGEEIAAGSAVDLVISSGAPASASEGDRKPESKPEQPKAPSQGDYILPDSATRVYKEHEVVDLSDWDLMVARNEIFARHGRGFKDKKLQEHFNGQSWYTKTYSPEEFDALSPSPLSKTERANVDMLLRVEKGRQAASESAQGDQGVSSTFVEDVRKALRIPDGLDGVTHSEISSSWWEGAGMTVYSITFYRNGETIASASCKADGTLVRDILSYNGK